MKVHILTSRPTENQIQEMLEAIKDYIKLAVDIERGVVAGGGGACGLRRRFAQKREQAGKRLGR